MWVCEIHDDNVQNHLLSRLNVKRKLEGQDEPKRRYEEWKEREVNEEIEAGYYT